MGALLVDIPKLLHRGYDGRGRVSPASRPPTLNLRFCFVFLHVHACGLHVKVACYLCPPERAALGCQYMHCFVHERMHTPCNQTRSSGTLIPEGWGVDGLILTPQRQAHLAVHQSWCWSWIHQPAPCCGSGAVPRLALFQLQPPLSARRCSSDIALSGLGVERNGVLHMQGE